MFRTLARVAIFGSLASSFLFSQKPVEAASYNPVYTSTCAPADLCLGYTNTNAQSSWGFYFEANADLPVNALGLTSQPGWPTGSASYEVQLWKYTVPSPNSVVYTFKTSATFVPGNSYTFDNGFFWQDLPSVINLEQSDATVDPQDQAGYVITTIGDFSNSSGNLGYEITSTATFSPFISYISNGFIDDNQDSLFPIPYFLGTDANGIPYTNAFLNANISLVPGPLPVLGAASAFAWSRRLRKRIKSI